MPAELPSVEEALKVFAGAMKALETPGLSKTEVMRLRTVGMAAKAYQEKVAEYMDYKGLERELIQMREQFAELKSQPVNKVEPRTSKHGPRYAKVATTRPSLHDESIDRARGRVHGRMSLQPHD